MKIAIINYGTGNLKSIENALNFLKIDNFIADNSKQLSKADKIILPWVWSAKCAMKKLKLFWFTNFLKATKKPVLWICLWLQLLSEFSEEGKCECLKIIKWNVEKLPNYVKTPQIWWNQVSFIKNNELFKDIPNNSFFYFVHSYYLNTDKKNIIWWTDYWISFPSIIKMKNFYATQFHPEKSWKQWLQLLSNFITKCK